MQSKLFCAKKSSPEWAFKVLKHSGPQFLYIQILKLNSAKVYYSIYYPVYCLLAIIEMLNNKFRVSSGDHLHICYTCMNFLNLNVCYIFHPKNYLKMNIQCIMIQEYGMKGLIPIALNSRYCCHLNDHSNNTKG